MLSVPPEVTWNKEEMASTEWSKGQLSARTSRLILVVSDEAAGKVWDALCRTDTACLPEGNVALVAEPNPGSRE